jgi:hypothetical protein
MIIQIEPRHDLSPNEIEAIEERIYDPNTRATGCDGQGLCLIIRNELGHMVDQFLILRFIATNQAPYNFSWVNAHQTNLDYGAVLARVSSRL